MSLAAATGRSVSESVCLLCVVIKQNNNKQSSTITQLCVFALLAHYPMQS